MCPTTVTCPFAPLNTYTFLKRSQQPTQVTNEGHFFVTCGPQVTSNARCALSVPIVHVHVWSHSTTRAALPSVHQAARWDKSCLRMTLPEDNFGDETKGDDEIHYNNMDMNMSERHGLASLHFTSLHFT